MQKTHGGKEKIDRSLGFVVVLRHRLFLFNKGKFSVSDYLGTVRFGVITNKHLAKLVSLVHSGSVYLHRHFNTSLVSILKSRLY